MRVAICDDNNDSIVELKKGLKEIETIHSIATFNDIALFWYSIEDNYKYDVVFMDINWQNNLENGIDFAKKLLEITPLTQIVYITGYNDIFSQQILLSPSNLCGYITKPIDKNILERVIKKAVDNLKIALVGRLVIQQKGVVNAILYREIVYIESSVHVSKVYTFNEVLSCYEKLDDIELRLSNDFIRCHKSYIINMSFIKRIKDKKIILQNGKEISISKARYSNVKTRFFEFMGQSI